MGWFRNPGGQKCARLPADRVTNRILQRPLAGVFSKTCVPHGTAVFATDLIGHFVKISGLTHASTSPCDPQSNGKLAEARRILADRRGQENQRRPEGPRRQQNLLMAPQHPSKQLPQSLCPSLVFRHQGSAQSQTPPPQEWQRQRLSGAWGRTGGDRFADRQTTRRSHLRRTATSQPDR